MAATPAPALSLSLAEILAEVIDRQIELERKLAKLEERIDQVGYQAGA